MPPIYIGQRFVSHDQYFCTQVWDAIVRVEQNLTNLTKVRACRVSCCAPCHRWNIMCATIAHGVLGFYHVMRLLVLFVSEHASEMGHGPSITTTTAVPEQEWS